MTAERDGVTQREAPGDSAAWVATPWPRRTAEMEAAPSRMLRIDAFLRRGRSGLPQQRNTSPPQNANTSDTVQTERGPSERAGVCAEVTPDRSTEVSFPHEEDLLTG